MIWIIIAAAVWLGCAYITLGMWYASFNKIDIAAICISLFGPISTAVGLVEHENGVCWNWIMKPDLSAAPWPPPMRTGLYACVICGTPTTDSPSGEPLCGATRLNHYRKYLEAGGTEFSRRKHIKAMRKVVGDSYVPPIPVSGQVTAAMAHSMVNQMKNAMVAPTAGNFSGIYFGSTREAKKDLPKSTSTETIAAFRVWRLDRENGLLRSCVQDFTWPRRKKIERDSFQHEGVHAVKHIEHLYASYPHSGGDSRSLWEAYQADVAGEVYLWGEVEEHELGYLAEFAYPKQLWMPEETDPLLVMKIEENYGVPVSLRAELKKHETADLSNTSSALSNMASAMGYAMGQGISAIYAYALTQPAPVSQGISAFTYIFFCSNCNQKFSTPQPYSTMCLACSSQAVAPNPPVASPQVPCMTCGTLVTLSPSGMCDSCISTTFYGTPPIQSGNRTATAVSQMSQQALAASHSYLYCGIPSCPICNPPRKALPPASNSNTPNKP